MLLLFVAFLFGVLDPLDSQFKKPVQKKIFFFDWVLVKRQSGWPIQKILSVQKANRYHQVGTSIGTRQVTVLLASLRCRTSAR